jgi:predicted nucleic acid-binding Zn ribbon protein
MAHCKHKSCGTVEKVWLPYEFEGRSRGLKPHSYCILCGVVKNISPDKAKPMGYYTNILARLRITKVQIRLIVKELERMGFDDVYSITRTEQEKIFNSVVKKYYKVPEDR